VKPIINVSFEIAIRFVLQQLVGGIAVSEQIAGNMLHDANKFLDGQFVEIAIGRLNEGMGFISLLLACSVSCLS